MLLPKIKSGNGADIMKADNGNDSLDTFIRQAIGKEPFLSLSRANDTPVQWMQLLNALDQRDLPGWPLLSPLKIQMQKCDKCSREFCSTINYRRHLRLHRRNLNLNKDSSMKSRGLLQAFWDKLSPEEAMEIMSFIDVCLEGVSGISIIKALTSFIWKSGFTSLPQGYIKSGSALLDIVQGRPLRFPISSQELFNILDDASERTFLYGGTAESYSLQKYVFDGEAGKVGLEMRNLVACTSFLVEQKLVKACLADKDAEALRYHNLLVQEEEAVQKRQAAILEKKRQKKLRQKEQRAKEHAFPERYDSPEHTSPSRTLTPSDPNSVLEHIHIIKVEDYNDKSHDNGDLGLDTTQVVDLDLDSYPNVDHKSLSQSGQRSSVDSHWLVPKLQRTSNGFDTNHNHQAPNLRRNMYKYTSTRVSRTKVWTRKPKSDTCKSRSHLEAVNLPGQNVKHEVLIGSISVTLGNCSNLERDENFGETQQSSALGIRERAVKTEANQSRPASRHGNEGQILTQIDGDACEVSIVSCNGSNEVQRRRELDTCSNCCEESPFFVESGVNRSSVFSSHMAKAFLAKRWKEAMALDHVKLVLIPEPRPPGRPKAHENKQEAVPSFKIEKRGILRSAENRLESYTKTRDNKPDKGSKVKYIPKQTSGY